MFYPWCHNCLFYAPNAYFGSVRSRKAYLAKTWNLWHIFIFSFYGHWNNFLLFCFIFILYLKSSPASHTLFFSTLFKTWWWLFFLSVIQSLFTNLFLYTHTCTQRKGPTCCLSVLTCPLSAIWNHFPRCATLICCVLFWSNLFAFYVWSARGSQMLFCGKFIKWRHISRHGVIKWCPMFHSLPSSKSVPCTIYLCV